MLSCAILCGGLATRLRPITETIPKSLIPINGEPFIAHQLRLLHSEGVRAIVLCVGYLGEQIEAFAGDGSRFGVELSYSYDGPELLGTAGALRKALPLLSNSFFVLYGDSYLSCDYASVGEAFQASGKPGLMTVFRNDGNFDTSNVEFQDGTILRYDKRNRTARMLHIDYGLGAFQRGVFGDLPPGETIDLATVYADLLLRGDLAGYEVHERFYEIGSPAGIQDLQDYLKSRQKVTT